MKPDFKKKYKMIQYDDLPEHDKKHYQNTYPHHGFILIDKLIEAEENVEMYRDKDGNYKKSDLEYNKTAIQQGPRGIDNIGLLQPIKLASDVPWMIGGHHRKLIMVTKQCKYIPVIIDLFKYKGSTKRERYDVIVTDNSRPGYSDHIKANAVWNYHLELLNEGYVQFSAEWEKEIKSFMSKCELKSIGIQKFKRWTWLMKYETPEETLPNGKAITRSRDDLIEAMEKSDQADINKYWSQMKRDAMSDYKMTQGIAARKECEEMFQGNDPYITREKMWPIFVEVAKRVKKMNTRIVFEGDPLLETKVYDETGFISSDVSRHVEEAYSIYMTKMFNWKIKPRTANQHFDIELEIASNGADTEIKCTGMDELHWTSNIPKVGYNFLIGLDPLEPSRLFSAMAYLKSEDWNGGIGKKKLQPKALFELLNDGRAVVLCGNMVTGKRGKVGVEYESIRGYKWHVEKQ